MEKNKLNKNSSLIIIVGILLISLLFNMYTSIMNSRYKMEAGKESYTNIENIKHRNESILVILEQSIEAKSISNEELLSLYSGYNSILDSTVQLCESYSTYEANYIVKLSKKFDKSQIKKNEVYSSIENLVFQYLTLEMKNEKSKIVLNGKILDDFIKLKEIGLDIKNYLDNFNNEYLSSVKDDKRESKIIKKRYWIDMYIGVNKVTEKYIDYPFLIQK